MPKPKPEVDESEFEMVSAGTRFGAAPKLAREWVGVPEVVLDNGKKAAFYATQLTAADVSALAREGQGKGQDGRFIQRRLAWSLRDGQGRRCWSDTETALAVIDTWPEHVIDRLFQVVNSLSETRDGEGDEPGKGSPETQTDK